ncbi:NUDIX domain-containing protein [Estrella lausannensis]|uniref:NUDIX family phosphohydrolase n=1 Tax=Estrella lausannensis TaxID=483423 RepID=A0A0H5DPK8_9BACT|nr:NUDIX domain-containing protein [Estrella lausannensis]CRX38506.1 NUDIX family phosphohydrolase [Estrella lausannensis]
MRSERSFGIIPVLIIRERIKILLVHHKSGGHWAFPKGHEEVGEDPKATAERELMEEAGLFVKKYLSEEMYQESYLIQKKGEPIEKSVGYFLAEVGGEVKLCEDELFGYVWLAPDEVDGFLTYKEAKRVWAGALSALQKVLP